MTIHPKLAPIRIALLLIFTVFIAATTHAQDASEALGPKDAPATEAWTKLPHPLFELMKSERSSLRPELRGVHPRVYVTDEGLKALRQRARTTHKAMWRETLANLRAFKRQPPPAPAQERRVQNDVGLAIAEAALAYKIEGDPKYLAAARREMDAAVSYDVWGYTYSKPNVDLAAGHLLYGLGWGYDLLYHDLTVAERAKYRNKLIRQANLLADFYKPKPGRTYSYSQNHVFIPMAGLSVAAYALYDEAEDAPQWAALSRAIYDRVLATYSKDGYYYESFEYWVFSAPWIVHFLDAHAHATGEDLWDEPGLREMHKYVAHNMLPDGQYVFDFGDIFEGNLTRAGKGKEYYRSHPGGRFHTNYNVLYRIASRFRSGEAQGVAAWMRSFNHVNFEDYMSLLWYDADVLPVPIEQQPTWHYFKDHEVVFWRDSWEKDATAFAFKSGPPEGHATTGLLQELPDWHLSSGHAHPDANSFIIYAKGKYLTGDTGYAGLPMTEQHNTVLINGQGQAREGKGHDVFRGIPYERLNRIRITEVKLDKNFAYVRGDAAASYEPELGVKRFDRHFLFTAPDGFVVWDDLQTEKPSIFTSLIHADDRIRQIADSDRRRFRIGMDDTYLLTTIIAPDEVRTKIEPNIVTAPGRPGSVDKGEQQERGVRLAISTAQPATSARFVKLFKIEGTTAGGTATTATDARR
ncbi:MAG: DUF4962 domain-containing protein [Pyrinomonadaceae bacterium MAG19_C2-C3]|nr:DUF4962 domain-containing protein [Pyrinomonadaceae bacterium MAG19_C2-C3]